MVVVVLRDDPTPPYHDTTPSHTPSHPTDQVFENSVSKITEMLAGMAEHDVLPECECFDTGIVRSIRMFERNGLMKREWLCIELVRPHSNDPMWNWLLQRRSTSRH